MRKIIVFCDGGARGNPGPAAAGCVVENVAEKKRFLCGKFLGTTTNNQAEYGAVKLAFQTIINHIGKIDRADFYLDSQLVTNQLSGLFKIKNPSLGLLVLEIRGLETVGSQIYYHHIRREKNTLADSLVNKALDKKGDFLEVQTI